MSKITHRQRGIAFLMLLVLAASTTITGWSSAFATDAHISDITLGHDKKMTEPTEEYEDDDTIFAAVDVEENTKSLKVIGRLHVVEIAGQKPGPIPGLEATVAIKGNTSADFSFSKPTKGWPHGKYMFEALLIDQNGETIDSGTHEFIVH